MPTADYDNRDRPPGAIHAFGKDWVHPPNFQQSIDLLSQCSHMREPHPGIEEERRCFHCREQWNALRKHFGDRWTPFSSIDDEDEVDLNSRSFPDAVAIAAESNPHIPLDLSNARLVGAVFEGARLINVNLAGADLTSARLRGADLVCAEMRRTCLARADLHGASLRGAHIQNAKLHEASFGQADLTFARVQDSDLSRANLNGADIRFTLFDRALLELAQFNEETITNSYTRFVNATGLYGRNRAHIAGDPQHISHAVFAHERDYVDWARLRWIGTFRLFGVSYAGLLLICAYALAGEWFNRLLNVIRSWAETFREDHDWRWVQWLAQLPDIQMPWHLAAQLILIVLLAAGSTIYQVICPEIVKENSETRWNRELRQPLMEYRSAMYHSIRWRYTCAALYAIGGSYTVVYLASRIVVAFRFIIGM